MKKIYVLTVGLILFGLTTKAQYTILHNFDDTGSNGNANGGLPWGNLTLSGNVFYGMTSGGGPNADGTIFSINKNGTGYKDLWDFDDTGTNGALPYGSLTLSGSVLYGVTSEGGKNNDGNIFSINTNGSGYKDLYDFGNGNVATPLGTLVLSNGKLYGMTENGGPLGKGNIFSINTDGTECKDLWDFDNSVDTNGAFPTGSLTLLGNRLYGMTTIGGANTDGVIFRIDTNGAGYKDLWDFDGGGDTNGSQPNGSLTIYGNKMYGMTGKGGANSLGNIFSIDTNGRKYKDLYNFNGSIEIFPYADLTISGKTLYGMTMYSGNIFSIDTNGSGYMDLLDFNGTNGSTPLGNLTISGDTLYGMTEFGGANDYGVIFGFADAALGINNLTANQNSIKVYPNPSSGKFTIQSTVVSGQLSVKVYDVLGKQVYLTPLNLPNRGDFEIDLSNAPNGIYLYRVIDENGKLIGEGKVVIQK